jgi:hypothetical protein
MINNGWSIVRDFCNKPGKNTKRKYGNAQNGINRNRTAFREEETQVETTSQ